MAQEGAPTRLGLSGSSKQEGNPYGANAEAFSEGPVLNPRTPDPTGDMSISEDVDGDESNDYVSHSAFKDTVG